MGAWLWLTCLGAQIKKGAPLWLETTEWWDRLSPIVFMCFLSPPLLLPLFPPQSLKDRWGFLQLKRLEMGWLHMKATDVIISWWIPKCPIHMIYGENTHWRARERRRLFPVSSAYVHAVQILWSLWNLDSNYFSYPVWRRNQFNFSSEYSIS